MASLLCWHGMLLLLAGQSLLSLWQATVKDQHSKRHVEFAGRAQNASSGTVALYQHLDKDEDRCVCVTPNIF